VGQRRQGDQMAVVGVHTARPDERHDVQDATALPSPHARGEESGSRVEGTIGGRRVDPGQVLEHRPTRTQVQVTDLRVPHLPWR
jgi:hypothetical protein